MTPYDLPLPNVDPLPPAHPARRAAVIVTPGTITYLLSIPWLVMQTLPPEKHRWLVTLCAEEPGNIRALGGFDVPVSAGLEALDDADTVLMPHWTDPGKVPSPALIGALQKPADDGKEVAGLCLGAYPLAYAGILDGHRAVTHWRFARDFRARFPRVELDPKALYIDDRNRITSGGIAAGNDCCLYLFRKHEGAAAANDVARNMLIPPVRDGGQAQYIDEPLARTTPSARLNLAMRYAEEHLREEITVESLARVASMSPRNFARSFRKVAGETPAAWLRILKLRKAEELLETTDLPIAVIAEDTGFQSPVTFRQAFQTAKAVSPQSYRKTFRAEETEPESEE